MSNRTAPLTNDKAYIITGPTSGIGYRTALELAKHGTVVLVGRDHGKLEEVRRTVEQNARRAIVVVCDMADLESVRRAASEIITLGLPLVGLINNAGVQHPRVTRNARGWDTTFATNHLGPFALTEALVPHLHDGGNVLFLGSSTEDPERKIAGFRGGRYLSVKASTRGEWLPGGSLVAGKDAYATSKQCNVATALAFARETPRICFNAVDPGFIPNTDLRREVNGLVAFVRYYVLPLLTPFMNHWSTTTRAARVVTQIMTKISGNTGVYYNHHGAPMLGSALVRHPSFQDLVVAETRHFLATA